MSERTTKGIGRDGLTECRQFNVVGKHTTCLSEYIKGRHLACGLTFKTNTMEQIIYHKIVNDIEVTWTKKEASPHAKRNGFKFMVEQVYRNLSTGVVTKDHYYTKG